ncbi:hypothetical protein CH330_09925 [candidate division WOR-3 bacterium JGI_Cruoil_03_51_56]|uniref:Fe/B12 periplasmic-binding domain-containing protein n=1 Tax=candidate division WOR-3 bacterium JGI_Cruoil_03_51_56 TaxID=1973747 RepID=A0A235BQA3_UNCW3|nr:MAG: hypothetical protein CH330_09925 [candidate division WOR-3 bacterium JGI_Cruoil_03_51_56]
MNRFLVFVVGLVLCCGTSQPAKVSRKGVVSLVPSVTEIVYALGAEDQLVGNTTYCDYPDAAKHGYKVGDFQNPDLERIISLRPRLVFLCLPAHLIIADKLKELGIAYYVSRPGTIEGVFSEIDSIGKLLGVQKRAEILVHRLRGRLDSLPVYPDTPRVYLEISDVPLMTVGGGSFINGIIRKAGGYNIFGKAASEYPIVDPEFVVRADPEVILILHPGLSAGQVGNRLGWSQISAVRNMRVFDDLDMDLLFRPGPRVVEGIIELSRRLHPE